jgi:hypothetical protein
MERRMAMFGITMTVSVIGLIFRVHDNETRIRSMNARLVTLEEKLRIPNSKRDRGLEIWGLEKDLPVIFKDHAEK